MTDLIFDWQGVRLEARPAGTLWWAERRWLIVADLHLGKSERMARRGGALLPPYELAETLGRLTAEIAATDPACVVSLGDAFDDNAAMAALPETAVAALVAMARGRDWLWIGGNHDPAAVDARLPGDSLREWAGPFVLRHEAADPGPDVSGHYHPCVRLAGQRRRAFVVGAEHLILPAFGAYTGGLPADDPAIARLVPRGIALACGGAKVLPVPLVPARRARLG